MTFTANSAHLAMLFREAAMLNARGIDCLTISDGEGAYHSFKKALGVLGKITKNFDDHEDVQSEDDETMEEPLGIWACAKPVLGASVTGDNSSFYVYNHALYFAAPSTPSQCNSAHCVAVLIFNMALTFHQRGLVKALTLYEQVITIVQACGVALQGNQKSESEEAETHILSVLARNNHIQILGAMGETDKTSEGLEDLRCMLARLNVQEDDIEHMDSLLADDVKVLEEVALNTLVFSPIKTTAAAA